MTLDLVVVVLVEGAGARVVGLDTPAPQVSLDLVIVLGGDGTLRYAAAQLLEAFGEIPALLVIPGGTANLMAQHLKLNWDADRLPEQVLDAVRKRKIQLLDAARANEELFLLIAGIGFILIGGWSIAQYYRGA